MIGGLVPVLAVVLYLSAGSPNLGGQPFLARQAGPIEQAPIMQVIAPDRRALARRARRRPGLGCHRARLSASRALRRCGRTPTGKRPAFSARRRSGSWASAKRRCMVNNGVVTRRRARRVRAHPAARARPDRARASGSCSPWSRTAISAGPLKAYRELARHRRPRTDRGAKP